MISKNGNIMQCIYTGWWFQPLWTMIDILNITYHHDIHLLCFRHENMARFHHPIFPKNRRTSQGLRACWKASPASWLEFNPWWFIMVFTIWELGMATVCLPSVYLIGKSSKNASFSSISHSYLGWTWVSLGFNPVTLVTPKQKNGSHKMGVPEKLTTKHVGTHRY